MTLVGCLAFLLFAAIVFYALYQRRDVRADLKTPFASLSFEAKDHDDLEQASRDTGNGEPH
jgi:hypothetical protein